MLDRAATPPAGPTPGAAADGRAPAGAAERAPLLDGRGVTLAFATALLLCWPMLLVTAPLGYPDTIAYHSVGERAIDLLARMVGGADPAAGQPLGGDDGMRSGRSFPYSAFLYLTSLTPLGPVLTTVLQTAMVLVMLLPFLTGVAPGRGWALGPAVLALGTLTTLPWFASYAMPDILAAGVLLYYMLLARRMDALPLGWQLAFAAIAAFAVASHYGHLPLAAGLAAVVLTLRAVARRPLLRAALLAAAPVLLAATVQLAGSAVALGEASVAPKRQPLLLARSIEDGPGARYLREACPEADYAICAAFEEVPDDMTTFLWSPEGIDSLTIAQLDAIRAEEFRLLWHIFRAYPGEQARALLGNVLLQTVTVGTGEVRPLVRLDGPAVDDGPGGPAFDTSEEAADASAPLVAFDVVTKVGTALGAILLAAALLRGRSSRADRELVAVCLLGLLGNALIFGGLSAPVDRYQSRLVWIVPVLAAILWLRAPPPSERTPDAGRAPGAGA